MALKVALETLDGLDEATQSLYVEREGAFVLDLEGVDSHPDVANLRNAYTAEKTKRQEQGEKLRDAQAQLAEALKKPKEDRTKADDQEIIRLRENLEAERDAALAERDDLKKQVYGLTVENQLDAAIRDAGITTPAFQKAAKRLLQDGVKVVDGKPVFDTDMGPLGLAEYVKRWASADGSAFVAPPSGGGASGSKSQGGAKKKPEEMNVQERGQLLKDDPEAFYKAFPHAKLR